MNLFGFRLAFADAIPVEVGPTANIRVASLRSLVVLKMSAYLDKPWDRETDLADIAHILQAFVGLDADERWSPEVVDLDLDYEEVGPYLLGTHLAPSERIPESALICRHSWGSLRTTRTGWPPPSMARRAPPAGAMPTRSDRGSVRSVGTRVGAFATESRVLVRAEVKRVCSAARTDASPPDA
jgi:hypothetical protein